MTINKTTVNPVPAGGIINPRVPVAQDVPSVPPGGTTGQALIKTSATDYDTDWGTVSGGGGGGTAFTGWDPDGLPGSSNALDWDVVNGAIAFPAGWSVLTGGAGVFNVVYDSVARIAYQQGQNIGGWSSIGFALPAGDFRFYARVQIPQSQANYSLAGVFLSNALVNNTQMYRAAIGWNGNYKIYVDREDTGVVLSSYDNGIYAHWITFAIRRIGSAYSAEWSLDGVVWHTLLTAVTPFFTPNYIGLNYYSLNQSWNANVFKFARLDTSGGTAIRHGIVRGTNASGLTPDSLPVSVNAADDEFEGAALDTAGTRRSGATAWAWRNQGAATWTQDSGYGILSGVAQTGSNLRIVEQVASGSAWKYRTLLRAVKLASATNYSFAGICVVNNGSGKVMAMYKGYNSGVTLLGDRWTNVTTYGSSFIGSIDLQAAHIRHSMNDPIYFEVELSGTNLIFRYSLDGVVWDVAATEALATFITSVDRIGLIVHNDTGANKPVGVYGWWHKVA